MRATQTSSQPDVRYAAKQFFSFIEAYASVRSKTKTNLKEAGVEKIYEIKKRNLPGVFVSSTGVDVVLSVERPELPPCPLPSEEIFYWVKDGWKDPKLMMPLHHDLLLEDLTAAELEALPEDQRVDEDGNPRQKEVSFEEDPLRIQAWDEWVAKRNSWLAQYEQLRPSNVLYNKLYGWKSTLDKEGYQKGCFLCNGFVRSEDGLIDYPVLLQQVFIEIDTEPAQPIIKVRLPDDVVTRISSDVLRQTKEDFDFAALTALGKTIEETGIDLLDAKRIREEISRLASSLSSKCVWQDHFDANFFNEATKYIFFPQPILFLTDLPNGVKDAVGKIKGLIDKDVPIPSPLKHLLVGYEPGECIEVPSIPDEDSISGRIATVGGESQGVLLALPANKDQLDIARKISYADAVLVQGPPGTGKTHTIANLLGNMLANGQRILVTSATDKALSVLRDKLPEDIQPLCVTLLDTKAGSSADDLRRAVEGICATIGRPGYESASLCAKDKDLSKRRTQVMRQLSDVRNKLFEVRGNECAKIPFQGEEHTLSDWAKWIRENQKVGEFIPDDVSFDSLTISIDDLKKLYGTNDKLSAEEEIALQWWLPQLDALPSPDVVREWLLDMAEFQIAVKQSPVTADELRHSVRFNVNGKVLEVPRSAIKKFKFDEAAVFAPCPAWLRAVQIAGMITEDAGHTVWDNLREQAEDFIEVATARRQDAQRPEVEFDDEVDLKSLRPAVAWFLEKAPDGKISLLNKLLNADKVNQYQKALTRVCVGGQPPSSAIEFRAILSEIDWLISRNKMARHWDKLIGSEGGPEFSSFKEIPEIEMPKFIKLLNDGLQWWTNFGSPIVEKIKSFGMGVKKVFGEDNTSANEAWRDAVWNVTQDVLIPISQFLQTKQVEDLLQKQKKDFIDSLTPPNGKYAANFVLEIRSSIVTDADEYASKLNELIRLEGLKDTADERSQLIKKLAQCAPKWAECIRSRKEGWTQPFLPDEILTSLRWHSICKILCSYNQLDYKELQHESHRLSQEFRSVSAELAAIRAWSHLVRRLENQPNILQSLRGWMTTVLKIGKGTGKKAPRLQVQARQQAKDCQQAIPIWVMTTQRALTTLDPEEKFDVIIVDEASQSDVTAMAVLFMGKRIIVVGDDQQVSPMGIGVHHDLIQGMQSEYLGGIRNASIYDESTSLYDIVRTVSSPVMLREHFRCASEIIGFSNWLSYDGKIIPLRDMSNCPIRSHVVPFRVHGKRTPRDTNPAEAKSIVALIKSCIEQPEYQGKTFGVISMFSGQGQAQAQLIERLLKEAITPKEYEKRRIVVGISANFQGDERDVIFLSLVQSRSDPEKLIRKEGYGVNNSTKKRYNVAVSRARDQLWVVHSFDPDADLAGDDIRRSLLMYVRNPYNSQVQHEAVIARTESPFEKDVATQLQARGYNLEPQHSVGCYRLDFVVRDGDRAVALECDGDRYHYSDPEKIAQDMERQIILERSGWSFVRVRGSEYYRDPESAIARICSEFDEHGIKPNYGHVDAASENDELLNRVKARAEEILRDETDSETLAELNDSIYADEAYLQIPVPAPAMRAEASVNGHTQEGYSDSSHTEEHPVMRGASLFASAEARDQTDEPLFKGKSGTECSPAIFGQDNADVDCLPEKSNQNEISNGSSTPYAFDGVNEGNQIAPSEILSDEGMVDSDEGALREGFDVQASSGASKDEKPIGNDSSKEIHAEAVSKTEGKQNINSSEEAPCDERLSSNDEEVLSTVNDFRWKNLSPEQQSRILEEDRYMFNCFKEHGWEIYDNRYAPKGSLWVIAGIEEFKPIQKHLYDKFGLYFKYSSKLSHTRGNKPGWWLANHTQNRGKK